MRNRFPVVLRAWRGAWLAPSGKAASASGPEPNSAAAGYIGMEHHGISYTVTRESHSGIWRWRTVLGRPAMVRAGEEATRIQAEHKVKGTIDWWLSQQARLQPDDPA